MTTAFELCGMLLAIVLIFAFIAWDTSLQFRRQMRAISLAGERAARETEDQAWAAFWAEADLRRQQIEDTLSAKDGMDRLVDLLNDRRKLEVVA